MTLKAPNASEKARWVDALKRVLNEYKEYDKERKNNAVNPSMFLLLLLLFCIYIKNKIKFNNNKIKFYIYILQIFYQHII